MAKQLGSFLKYYLSCFTKFFSSILFSKRKENLLLNILYFTGSHLVSNLPLNLHFYLSFPNPGIVATHIQLYTVKTEFLITALFKSLPSDKYVDYLSIYHNNQETMSIYATSV